MSSSHWLIMTERLLWNSTLINLMLKLVEKNSWNDLLPPTKFLQFFKNVVFFMKIEWYKRSADGGMFGNSLCAQNATESVLFLSYFIGPVLYWRTVWKKVVGMHCKYMISFKMFVLRPMENQLVPSPHMKFQDSTIPLFRRCHDWV